MCGAGSTSSKSTRVSTVADPLPASDEVEQPVSPRADGAVPAPSESQSRMTLSTICELEDPPFGLVAARLQGCIDIAPPFSSVEIPRGFYLLESQVVIRKPLTIRTVGSADGSITCSSGPDGCANLVASPRLDDDNGVLSIQSTTDVTLEHIVLDGNRRARLHTRAFQACRAGRNTAGFSASVIGCVRCAVHDIVATLALCGTGLLWVGAEGHHRAQ